MKPFIFYIQINLKRIETVSYTHLDVYKRQTVPCSIVGLRLLNEQVEFEYDDV